MHWFETRMPAALSWKVQIYQNYIKISFFPPNILEQTSVRPFRSISHIFYSVKLTSMYMILSWIQYFFIRLHTLLFTNMQLSTTLNLTSKMHQCNDPSLAVFCRYCMSRHPAFTVSKRDIWSCGWWSKIFYLHEEKNSSVGLGFFIVDVQK